MPPEKRGTAPPVAFGPGAAAVPNTWGTPTMTAEHQQEQAPPGVFARLKRIREQWLVVVALASALFWARDWVEVYAGLPARLDRQEVGLQSVSVRTGWLEAVVSAWPGRAGGRSDRLPGVRFGLGTLSPGQTAVIAWPGGRPEERCTMHSATGVMVDAAEQWFPVTASLAPEPNAETQGLAVAVAPHPGMEAGQARLKLRLTRECPDRQRIEISPWLVFALAKADSTAR